MIKDERLNVNFRDFLFFQYQISFTNNRFVQGKLLEVDVTAVACLFRLERLKIY